jgi:hypothetical protein
VQEHAARTEFHPRLPHGALPFAVVRFPATAFFAQKCFPNSGSDPEFGKHFQKMGSDPVFEQLFLLGKSGNIAALRFAVCWRPFL